MTVVYMCRWGFKNGGLSEWPLTEKKTLWILELKITKKHYSFENGGLL